MPRTSVNTGTCKLYVNEPVRVSNRVTVMAISDFPLFHTAALVNQVGGRTLGAELDSRKRKKGQAGKIVTFTILFLLMFKDDAKVTPLITWGNSAVQPRQSFAVSGATRGRGSASEVTTCLGSLWPSASGPRSSLGGAELGQVGKGE